MHLARTGLVTAALLLALGGCASAEDLAAPEPDDSSQTSDSPEPSDEPSDDETSEEPEPSTPNVSECRRLSSKVVSAGIADSKTKTVPCKKGHNTQTIYVTTAGTKARTALQSGNLTKIFNTMHSTCRKRLEAWTGGDKARLARANFGVLVGVPPAEDVELGANWIRCDISLFSADSKPVRLPKNTKGALSSQTSDYDLCVRGNFSKRKTKVVLCDQKHDFRSVATVKLGNTSKAYPGEKKVRKTLSRRCPVESRKFTGSGGASGWTYPVKKEWSRSSGYGVCYAKTKK